MFKEPRLPGGASFFLFFLFFALHLAASVTDSKYLCGKCAFVVNRSFFPCAEVT